MNISTVWTIARREIWVKLRDKAFLGGFVAMLAIVAIAMVIPMLAESGTPSYTVGAVGPTAKQTAETAAEIAEARIDVANGPFADTQFKGSHITVVDAPADAAAQTEALINGDLDAILSGEEYTSLTLTGKEQVADNITKAVGAAASQLQAEEIASATGLTPDQLTALTTPIVPTVAFAVGSADQYLVSQVASFVFAMLFFFATLFFGLAIAQSVVEEKQSRVVEILVAAVPTRTLLAGKILGNTILAAGQLVIFISLGLVATNLMGYGGLLGLLAASSAWYIVFFIAGFVMLACLWAVVGSMASRMEDLSSSTTVMQFVVMIPFFTAIFVRDPMWTKVLSYVPFTAPLIMPTRILAGQAVWWEPIVSLLIVLATAALLIVLGAKLYSASILHTSGRLKFGQAWKSARTQQIAA